VVAAGLAVAVVLATGYVVLGTPTRALLDQRGATAPATDEPVEPTAPAGSTPPSATAGATPTVAAPRYPSGLAMPNGDLPAWRQIFTEDFGGTALPPEWVSYDGQPINDPGGYFASSHVSVADGVLNIGAWREKSHRNIYVTGGVSNRKVYSEVYGRVDIRFRMDRGRGVAYALLLWPTSNNPLPEIDIAEDNGFGRDRLYSVMHSADGTAHIGRDVGGDFTTWHTAGVEWSPGQVTFTVDGKPWTTIKHPGVSSVPMSVALQSQAWFCGHGWQACPDKTTPKRVDLEVDWVVAYERSK
jgi:beta-glucanase (GH16 family)